MRTSFLSIGLLGLVLFGISLKAGYGQAKKETLEEALKKAKDEYRSKIDETEVKLILALEQRIESARKAGDKKTLDLATAERDQFNADGTLPKIVEKAAQTFQRQSAAARKKLELVYRSQIKEYVKRSEDAKAEALEQELDTFLAPKLDDISKVELIRNGDCEEELNTENSPWIVTQGKWDRRSESPAPQAGKFFFWPGEAAEAELTQEIDLTKFAKRIDLGLLKLEFSGYVRTLSQPQNDTSRIILEMLDAEKKKPLETFDSGEIVDVENWQQIKHSRVALKGTRWVRIRLKAKKYAGTENNGYFDSLSLRLLPRAKLVTEGSK